MGVTVRGPHRESKSRPGKDPYPERPASGARSVVMKGPIEGEVVTEE